MLLWYEAKLEKNNTYLWHGSENDIYKGIEWKNVNKQDWKNVNLTLNDVKMK
jgi:hypothetical protein